MCSRRGETTPLQRCVWRRFPDGQQNFGDATFRPRLIRDVFRGNVLFFVSIKRCSITLLYDVQCALRWSHVVVTEDDGKTKTRTRRMYASTTMMTLKFNTTAVPKQLPPYLCGRITKTSKSGLIGSPQIWSRKGEFHKRRDLEKNIVRLTAISGRALIDKTVRGRSKCSKET